MSQRFLLPSLLIVFLFTFTITPFAVSSPSNIPNQSVFSIATVEKMADSRFSGLRLEAVSWPTEQATLSILLWSMLPFLRFHTSLLTELSQGA